MEPHDLVLVDHDILRARTEQVAKVCAELAALAHLPADAHSSLFIFFDVEMTLIVAVFPNRDAFETRGSAFMVDLAAKRFFSCSAWCVCSVDAEVRSVFDALIDLISGSCSELVVVKFVLIRTRAKVRVREEVVWVQAVSHCGTLLVAWRGPECESS